MNQYRCQLEELPYRLYRAQYQESQTLRIDVGLEAADTATFYNDSVRERELFKRAVENHFTWGYRGRSPFISLFSDRDHAKSWGNAQPWRGWNRRGKEQWTLCTIDTGLLDEIYVFKVSKIVDVLGVEIPEKAEQHKHGSYICLHRVPTRAIHLEETGSRAKDFLEYGSDHQEYFFGYDSDDSAIQNNINDNIIRMIEDDW
ncbi:hypothetical protein F4806DRAFT_304308 [Annulohypoxylon nitens]|nr:hypothetical protein F4806DRAFT_304308 [Annulohypoxylon nitens]